MNGRVISSSLFLFLLVASLIPFVTPAATATDLSVSVKTEVYRFGQDYKREHYIVFVDRNEDFSSLLNNYEVIKVFNNLRAAIVNINAREASRIEATIGTAFSIADNPAPNWVEPVVPASSGIGLDSTEDAPYMQVDKLWDMNYTGQGVVVGIIDNGIEMSHDGLEGRIISQKWIEIEDLGSRNPFHGTAVAGTIVGNGYVDPMALGNAYNASVIAASWRMRGGQTFETGPDDILYYEAWDYMLSLNQTVKVINFSGGGSYYAPFQAIFDRFEDAGVLVVASAGNEGPAMETVGCPACFLPNLAVGATERPRLGLTDFSSVGPAPVAGIKPDVVAIGSDVYTTAVGNSYERVSGTSFSSPLTAGAIASLISGLNAENYSWNIGTLKAAVIRGAYMDSGRFDYFKGAGDVKIYNSYKYLKDVNNGSSFASALAVTPLSSNIFDTTYFPDRVTSLDGFSVITSNASDVQMMLEGNITSILSLNMSRWNPNRFTQYIPLDLDTTGAAAGRYMGTVNVTLGSETLTVNLKVTVLSPPVGKVLMDLRHSDADAWGEIGRNGFATNKMVQYFRNMGYRVDNVEDVLTDSLLANYDILWLHNPLRVPPFLGENVTDAEITAIHNFVDNGGSVLINFRGTYIYPGYGPDGVYARDLNRITSGWGITAETNASMGISGTETLPLNNVSNLVGTAEQVSFSGNYLYLDQDVANQAGGVLRGLTLEGNRTTIATFEQSGGGRVIVSSSEAWLSNSALRGETESSREMGINVIKWLIEKDRLSVVSEEFTGNSLSVTVSSPTPVSVMREKNRFIDSKEIPVTDNGDGTYTFSYSLDSDGVHQILVSAGDKYLRWTYEVDILGPRITSSSENGSVFKVENEFQFVEFSIADPLYEVKLSDISVTLDGEEPSPVLFPTFFSNGVLKIKLTLTELDLGSHTIRIEASDNTGHVSVYNWVFTVESSVTTSDATSSTTPVDTSSETKAGFSNLTFLAVFSLAVVVPVISRRKKN